ncbi:MAG TPA: hypothetical protein VMH04_18485 [Candidatus Solibacter sp.]|nr:hypothetical protein [Candidatus Solibacter sp.]
MCRKYWCAAVLLLCAAGAYADTSFVKPTTTLAAQQANNTSAASGFTSQTNGNSGAGSVSKVDAHSLLYAGASTKIYAHLLLWFGGSNHMNVGYSSTDAAQVHRQIEDMISRGIDGVIVDWYGPNNSIDQATKLVMAEAETHPGFTFAIMVDQGAIEWDSCSGCSPQDALINQLQYIEQTYFTSPAYMTQQGRPVVTNFNIDQSYSVDWNAVNAALSSNPLFIFQNNDGFTHVLSDGSYSWVMPTTNDYGMSYLTSFYDTGIPLTTEQTVGATYKGFNDTLASWGSNRIMGQQCGQTWLHTFSEVNGLYNSGKQLPWLQLVTWNDYEEATEIESGISNCFSVSASVKSGSLQWSPSGDSSTIDHYVAYISTDGQNLMALSQQSAGASSINLCSYGIPNGQYTLYVQAVGKPSLTNQISGPVTFTSSCQGTSTGPTLTLGTNPTSLTISYGGSGKVAVTTTPQSGSFNSAIQLSCAGLPSTLTCSFDPPSVTPGSQAVSSVLTISDRPVASMRESGPGAHMFFAIWLVGFGAVGCTLIGKVELGKIERKRLLVVLGTCLLATTTVGSISCGGSSTQSVAAAKNPPANYIVTVNGSATSVQLSTTVAVTVQ